MENTPFGDLLNDLMKGALRTPGQLAELTGIPLKTIESWQEGRVARPRDWQAIVRLASALVLPLAQANALLRAAGQPALDQLRQRAQDKQDQAALLLFQFWENPRADSQPSVPTATRAAPVFQAIPEPALLVGREQEFSELCQALQAGQQLCVLWGMPGVGKTVLAAKAAYALQQLFPDGVLWAQLDKSSPMAILQSFSAPYGLDLKEQQDEATRSAAFRNLLVNKRVLIILDSAHKSEDVGILLPPTNSHSAVIVTTTNAKVLPEALVINLKPFATAGASPGLTLFQRRLQTRDIAAEQAAFIRIMELVGGLPLALQVIAGELAQATYLSAADYYDLLYDERERLENLTDGNDASKGVLASFELSYRHLSPSQQTLFATLAIFAQAEFSVEAVAWVAQTSLPMARRTLEQLRALSLVEPYLLDAPGLSASAGASASYLQRYRLHNLLQLFATEKLADQQPLYQARAASYYADFARSHSYNYPLLALEWENLAANLTWAFSHQAQDLFMESIQQLTLPHLGFIGFLDAQGHWRQARHWLEQALAHVDQLGDPLLSGSLHCKLAVFDLRLAAHQPAETGLHQALAALAGAQPNADGLLYQAYACDALAQVTASRDLLAALPWSEQGLAYIRRSPAPLARAEAGYLQIRHATILARNGELASARVLIDEALTQLLPPHPTAARVSGLITLGNIYDLQGQTTKAHDCWLQGVPLAESLGDNRRLAGLWLNLAIQAEEQGNFAACLDYNPKALELYRRIGDVDGEGRALSNLAFAYLRQEQPEAALPYLQAAHQLTQSHPLDDLVIHVRVNYARWHLLRGEVTLAHSLLAEALGLSERLGESEILGEIYYVLAQVALQRGDFAQAQVWVDKALAASDEESSEAGLAWGLKGEILGKLGEVAQVEAAFQHSIALLARYPFDQAKVQVAWARHAMAQQSTSQAQALWTTALVIFQQLQLQREIDAVQTLIKQLSAAV